MSRERLSWRVFTLATVISAVMCGGITMAADPSIGGPSRPESSSTGGTGPAGESRLDRAQVERLYTSANSAFTAALERASKDRNQARALFAEAAALYSAAADGGEIRNPDLATNIGNARFLAGEHPGAIAAYRSALKIDPSHANALRGLQAARRGAGTESLAPRSLFVSEVPAAAAAEGASGKPSPWSLSGLTSRVASLMHRIILFATPELLIAGAGTLYVLAFGLATGRVLGVRRLPGWAPPVSFVASILIALPAVHHDWQRRTSVDAVVLQPSTIGRQGPAELYDPAFQEPLRPGLEVRVLEARDGWYRIALADGRQCWTDARAVEVIR